MFIIYRIVWDLLASILMKEVGESRQSNKNNIMNKLYGSMVEFHISIYFLLYEIEISVHVVTSEFVEFIMMSL